MERPSFRFGEPFKVSGIQLKLHIQVAARQPSCIIGYLGLLELVNGSAGESLDIGALWSKTAERLRDMTPDERRETLVSAGILTSTGRVKKPYRRVVQFPKKSTA